MKNLVKIIVYFTIRYSQTVCSWIHKYHVDEFTNIVSMNSQILWLWIHKCHDLGFTNILIMHSQIPCFLNSRNVHDLVIMFINIVLVYSQRCSWHDKHQLHGFTISCLWFHIYTHEFTNRVNEFIDSVCEFIYNCVHELKKNVF